MARIIVTTERRERPGAPVLLDERVCPEHLSDDHSAAQLIERLGWAINDAENIERVEPAPYRRTSSPTHRTAESEAVQAR